MSKRPVVYHLLLWTVGLPLLAVSADVMRDWLGGNWATRLLFGMTLFAGTVATWVAVFRPRLLEPSDKEERPSLKDFGTVSRKTLRVLLQACLGLAVALAMFAVGAFVSEYLPHEPDLRHAYLTLSEQAMVGTMIGVGTAAIALMARFAVPALFITAAFVAGLLLLVGEFGPIAPHTALPIAIAAVLVLGIRRTYARLGSDRP